MISRIVCRTQLVLQSENVITAAIQALLQKITWEAEVCKQGEQEGQRKQSTNDFTV